MNPSIINFSDKLAKFSDHWAPKVIAQMNDYQFKLVCKIMLVEPCGVVNTGEAGGAYTAPNDVWI